MTDAACPLCLLDTAADAPACGSCGTPLAPAGESGAPTARPLENRTGTVSGPAGIPALVMAPRAAAEMPQPVVASWEVHAPNHPVAAVTTPWQPPPAEPVQEPWARPAQETPARVTSVPGSGGWGVRESPRRAAARTRGDALTPTTPGGGVVPAPDAPGMVLPPVPWTPTPPRSTRTAASKAAGNVALYVSMRAVVAVVVALVALGAGGHNWLGDLIHGKHAIRLPAAVAGKARITSDASLNAVAKASSGSLARLPGVEQVLAAFYGSGAAPPLYAVIVTRGDHSSLNTGAFITGLERGGGATVDRVAVAHNTVNGIDFACFPADYANGQTASVCVWDDYNVVGAVIAVGTTNTGATLTAAIQAQRDAEQ